MLTEEFETRHRECNLWLGTSAPSSNGLFDADDRAVTGWVFGSPRGFGLSFTGEEPPGHHQQWISLCSLLSAIISLHDCVLFYKTNFFLKEIICGACWKKASLFYSLTVLIWFCLTGIAVLERQSHKAKPQARAQRSAEGVAARKGHERKVQSNGTISGDQPSGRGPRLMAGQSQVVVIGALS